MGDIVSGIDISNHQGTIDYDKVAGAGHQFAIAKCTEGGDWADPKFSANMEAIKALNGDGVRIYPGAYHFARPDIRSGRAGGELEGKWFSKTLLQLGADTLANNFLPPALDYEKYNEDGAASNQNWVSGFLEVVENETGRRPMIYTGPNVWMYQLGNTAQFSESGLWEVDYSASGADPDGAPTPMPKNDNTASWPYSIWQWSGGGDSAHAGPVPGIPGSGVCDVNRFSGTLVELASFAQAKG